jgi:hemoglobin-like flavoprotein
MTPEQLDLVRTSYAALGERRTAMAADFYRRLFASDPTTEELFTASPDVMSEMFSTELAAIVDAISSFEVVAPRLHDLAGRHAAYGVQVRHYRLVGDALLAALAAALAPAWDDELEAAWRRAYDLVAEVMMGAMAQGGDGARET